MNTITVILEPEPDGTLRLPVPEEFKSRKVKVVATFEEPKEVHKSVADPLWGIWKDAIIYKPGWDEPLEEFKEYAK